MTVCPAAIAERLARKPREMDVNLIVIGDSVERSLPVAALAAVTSGERVLFTSMQDMGEITVEVAGENVSGTAVIASVDPHAAMAAHSFVVAAPSCDHEAIFASRPDLYAGKSVLLAPGGFAGALVNAERFRGWGLPMPRFSEVPGWLAGGYIEGQQVHITMRKRNLDIAGASNEETAGAVEHFGRFFPDLVGADLLATSLSNINAIIHPPLAIMNATRMENAEAWCYWDEGFTPGVHRLMAAVDRERIAVIETLGGKAASLLDMAVAAYAESGFGGSSFYEAVKQFPLYRGRRGPAGLDSRFLTDDVPNGIAAYEQLAQALGVEHPALTAMRVMSEIIVGRELKTDAAAVEALARYAFDRTSSRMPQIGEVR
jgi:opine dehydrogenase